MLRALVTAATAWMTRGLPIQELRIMEAHPGRVEKLAPVFEDLKRSMKKRPAGFRATMTAPPQFDVFLSFPEEDCRAADVVREQLGVQSGISFFDYRTCVDPGKVWQDAIEAAMESCRKVVAFLSPAYFSSVECKEELSMARLRHKRANHSVLVPLYVRSLENAAELPLWLQTVTYVDYRETDEAKLAAAGARLTNSAGS